MRSQSLTNVEYRSQWLTTADVARMLERTPWSVRWMARTGRLVGERTESGQRLFRLSEVQRVIEERARARLRRVTALRPKVFNVRGEPRQLSLFSTAPLRLVSTRKIAHGSVGTVRAIAADRG